MSAACSLGTALRRWSHRGARCGVTAGDRGLKHTAQLREGWDRPGHLLRDEGGGQSRPHHNPEVAWVKADHGCPGNTSRGHARPLGGVSSFQRGEPTAGTGHSSLWGCVCACACVCVCVCEGAPHTLEGSWECLGVSIRTRGLSFGSRPQLALCVNRRPCLEKPMTQREVGFCRWVWGSACQGSGGVRARGGWVWRVSRESLDGPDRPREGA